MADRGPPNSTDGQPEPADVQPAATDAVPAPADIGQGLVEYGLGLFLMAIVILVILQLVGPRIGSIFSRLTQVG